MFLAACPAGTYKNTSLPGDVSTCLPCRDEYPLSPPGSTSSAHCFCPSGFHSPPTGHPHSPCQGDRHLPYDHSSSRRLRRSVPQQSNSPSFLLSHNSALSHLSTMAHCYGTDNSRVQIFMQFMDALVQYDSSLVTVSTFVYICMRYEFCKIVL